MSLLFASTLYYESYGRVDEICFILQRQLRPQFLPPGRQLTHVLLGSGSLVIVRVPDNPRHIYTNTIYDFELSGNEPFVGFKASPSKNWMQCPFLYPFMFFFDGIKRAVFIVSGQKRLRPENLLPLVELLVAVMFTSLLWASSCGWESKLLPVFSPDSSVSWQPITIRTFITPVTSSP